MPFLSEQELNAISEAIGAQERRTRAELMTVVCDASDSYRYIPVLWASLLSMFIPGCVYLLGWWDDFVSLYSLQVLLFVGLALAFRHPLFKYRLIPKAVLHERAARMARQQFLAQGLHHTEQRLGVLIFVSVAEHYVEILADKGAAEQIDHAHWETIVQAFTARLGAGQAAAGFIAAIESCGERLAEVEPQTSAPRNDLPNHLVVLNVEDTALFD